MVNSGFQFTEAAQINMPGFAEDRETVFRGNSGVMTFYSDEANNHIKDKLSPLND